MSERMSSRQSERVLARAWVQRLVVPLFAAYVRLVQRTSRVLSSNDCIPRRLLDRGRPFVACGWHGRLPSALVGLLARRFGGLAGCLPRERPLCCLTARRAEGRMYDGTLRRLGIDTIAASPEGLEAPRRVREALLRGVSVWLAVDGPRGPHMQISPDTVRLAGLAGAPLVPVGCSSALRMSFRTWDHASVPLPFGRTVLVFGEPIEVSGRSRAEAGASAQLLEERLNAATVEAERLCGRPGFQVTTDPAASGRS